MSRQANLALGVDADHAASKAAMAEVPGVLEVQQVFPDHDDPELRRMYVLEVEADDEVELVEALRAIPGVAEVELVSPRGRRSKRCS